MASGKNSEYLGPNVIHSLEEVQSRVGDPRRISLQTSFHSLAEDERQRNLQEFCSELVWAIKVEGDHLKQLDGQLSSLLPDASGRHAITSSSDPPSTGPAVSSEAICLLRRLPDVPQTLFSLPLHSTRTSGQQGTLWDSIVDGRWASKFLMEDGRAKIPTPVSDPQSLFLQLEAIQDIAWEKMFVTSFIDTNNLCLILKISAIGHQASLDLAIQLVNYANLLSEVIDVYEGLADIASLGVPQNLGDASRLTGTGTDQKVFFGQDDDTHEQELEIVKTFLWSAWQRSVTLTFHYIVGVQLWHGPSSEWSSLLSVRGLCRLDHVQVQDYRGAGTPYLCNWAFELLRHGRTSLALDFRRLISRFDDHFQGREGRCIKGSGSSCQGKYPETCQRFTGSATKSQSAHAKHCAGGCPRLIWDEESYRRCNSPRAVNADEDVTSLRYCMASSQTMAISHVWSHGHGGRPEEGVNLCLHKLYCGLAKSLSCDSYWIDSTCIPEDDELRREAIRAINGIFSTSKATVVLDKDVQSIGIEEPSIAAYETLFSVLLVCDWGVRAWTMLEAIRGSRSLHVLCKNEEMISLNFLFQYIHRHGAIELAVLLGSVQHLLPSSDSRSTLDVEEVGHLLSQRHASRVDDELIIWALLSSDSAPKSPLGFWQERKTINTAFLVSSASRIQGRLGYGWCPITPYIRPQERFVSLEGELRQYYTVRYPSYDGRGSFAGKIIPSQGLLGKWLAREMDCEEICRVCDENEAERSTVLWLDQSRETILHTRDFDPDVRLFPRPDVAGACARIRELAVTSGYRVSLLRPLAEDGLNLYEGGTNRGEDFNLLTVVCYTTRRQSAASIYNENSGDFPHVDKTYDQNSGWRWDGVYEWEDDSTYAWKPEEVLLI